MLNDLSGQTVLVQQQVKSENKYKFLRIFLLLVLLSIIVFWVIFVSSIDSNSSNKKLTTKPKQNLTENISNKNISKTITNNNVAENNKLTLQIDKNINLTGLETLENLEKLQISSLNLPTNEPKKITQNLVENIPNIPNIPPTKIINNNNNKLKNQNQNLTTENTKINANAKIVKTDLIPQSAYDYFQAANNSISQGNSHDAIIALREALAIAPNYHEARKLLVMQLYNNKQINEASEVANRGADLYGNENPDWSIISARLLLEKGEVNQAKNTLQKNSNKTMHRVDYQMLMAYTALQQKDYQQANEHYQQVIKTQPRNAAAWFGLAQTLEHQDKAAANQAYQQALNIGNLTPDLQRQAEQKIMNSPKNQNKENNGEITSITASPINKSKKVITEVVEPTNTNNSTDTTSIENSENVEKTEITKNTEKIENTQKVEIPPTNTENSKNELNNTKGTILGL